MATAAPESSYTAMPFKCSRSPKALDESLQVLPGCPVEQWLDALLQTLCQDEDRRTEVVA